jgi:hypothetical protein
MITAGGELIVTGNVINFPQDDSIEILMCECGGLVWFIREDGCRECPQYGAEVEMFEAE